MAAQLRFGWWNTKLASPASTSTFELGTSRHLQVAQGIVTDMLEGELGLDVLALGEVDPAHVDALLARLSDPNRFGRSVEEKRRMVVLYDTSSVEFINDSEIITIVQGQVVIAGKYLVLVSGGIRIHLVAVHWPSHWIDELSESQRLKCGNKVQDLLYELNQAVDSPVFVVLGDFNDEPFAPSMTRCMQGSRDRRAVQRNSDLLYNPFWRWLGERTLFEDRLEPLGAGTHFWDRVPLTSWYTFDQALVSSATLRESGWTLVEGETRVLPVPRLLTLTGRMRAGFDHLPIVLTLQHVEPGSP